MRCRPSDEPDHEGSIAEPRDGLGVVRIPGGDELRIVGPAPEFHDDFGGRYLDIGACVDEFPEDGARPCGLEAIADAGGEDAVEGAGHERELEVEIDFHGHAGRRAISC